MTVGVVVVSHSDLLARGVVELAAAMAPGVRLLAAGGTSEGGVGTSFDRVLAALSEADDGDGVLVLADLGSAELVTEQALEFLDAEHAARVRLVDAPVAEGAVAAATTAEGGAGLDAVEAAATQAGRRPEAATAGSATARSDSAAPAPETAETSETVVLVNPLGLHARPAAQLLAALGAYDAEVTVTRTDTGAAAAARSVLDVVALGATGGTEVEVAAAGRDAEAAVGAAIALIREGFGESDTPSGEPEPEVEAGSGPRPAHGGPPPAGTLLRGTGVVVGTVIGPLATVRRASLELPEAGAGTPTAEHERARLDEARERARAELRRLATGPQAAIFDVHLLLLDDPALEERVSAGLAAGQSAAQAWSAAIEEVEARLTAMPDETFAARGLDVRDVGDRVLSHLLGGEHVPFEAPPQGSIVAASDAVPSLVPQLVESGATGLALAGGSRTSHAAVLAGNLGLPLVVGLGASLLKVPEGTEVALDGSAGTVLVAPDASGRDAVEASIAEQREAREEARTVAAEPAHLADGTRIEVAANASSVAEAIRALESGAEGIGLLRTEFLFTERNDLPSEDEQFSAIAAVCAAMGGRPVIVRTLDAGGDKPAPALDLDPVRNGFLGVRGLRLSLARPELFHTQLRAILRVAAQHPVKVMFPMVTLVDEVRAAKAALDEAADSLRRDGAAPGAPLEVGIMVEVPAAAIAPEPLVEEVDFCSVGSNDLVAYTMAADRTLDEVAHLYQPAHPAILDLIGRLCDVASRADCWVGVCGESAGDPDMAEQLVRLGVRELSMAAGSIAGVKARLREVSLDDDGTR